MASLILPPSQTLTSDSLIAAASRPHSLFGYNLTEAYAISSALTITVSNADRVTDKNYIYTYRTNNWTSVFYVQNNTPYVLYAWYTTDISDHGGNIKEPTQDAPTYAIMPGATQTITGGTADYRITASILFPCVRTS